MFLKLYLKKNTEILGKLLPNISFYIKDYDILSYEQYLDILENRKVSNTWYFVLSITDKENSKSMGFVFFFERLKATGTANLIDKENTKRPHVKLFVVGRNSGNSFKLGTNIDLVNVGTHRDQLSFGVNNRNWRKYLGEGNKRASIITVKDNPNKIARTFLDQILFAFFDIGKKKKATNES